MNKKVFVNLIKYQYDIYNKYSENKLNSKFYFDYNYRYPGTEKIYADLNEYFDSNQYIYCICVIYNDNNGIISRDNINVSEIGIFKLYKNIDCFNKEFLYETYNINYIKYILSTYLKAIDNWSTKDFYGFISSREFIERLEEFINFSSNGRNTLKIFVDENELNAQYIYNICFLNSYKRLQDKAQVFSAIKGDHYRNRLIHTNEVVVISTMLVDAINQILNFKENNNCEIDSIDKDIVIAIALGHDIGHTPFGHQGERTLNDIIENRKFNIIKNAGEEQFKIKLNDNYNIEIKTFGKLLFEDTGGFKHNVQSVRVLTEIENDGYGQAGIKIKPEILEGILKHTKYEGHEKMLNEDTIGLVNIENCYECKNTNQTNYKSIKSHILEDYKGRKVECDPQTYVPCYVLKNFSNIYANKHLSGEIVAFADEIAQRCSDIEDAIRSDFVSFDEFGQWLIDMKYNDVISKDDLCEIDEKIKMARLRKNIISYYIVNLSQSILFTKDCNHIFLIENCLI